MTRPAECPGAVCRNEWRLLRLLPNLALTQPFEFDGYAIVPWSEPRYAAIRERASQDIFHFTDIHGDSVQPAAMIRDSRIIFDGELAVNIRNVFAISALLRSWTFVALGRGHGRPRWSDYFDFYPVYLSRDEQTISIESMNREGMHVPIPSGWRFQTDPSLGVPGDVFFDESILTMSGEMLRSHTRSASPLTRGYFRAFAVAYDAMRMPRGEAQIEFGNRIALWVSAHEVLVHHRNNHAVCADVFDLLGTATFEQRSHNHRRYKCRVSKKVRKPGSLLQSIYGDLDGCRNKFLHGNRLSQNALYFKRRASAPHLFDIAPLVFRTAVATVWRQAGSVNAHELAGADDYQYELALARVAARLRR